MMKIEAYAKRLINHVNNSPITSKFTDEINKKLVD